MDDSPSSQKAVSFLPALIENNYRLMLHEGLLNEKEKAFFVDSRLEKFWKSVDKYLGSVKYPEHKVGASEFLVGCFLAPVHLYGQRGTRKRPNIKTESIDRQRKADKLRKDAAYHAGKLSAILQQLDELKSFNPETMLLMSVIEPLIGDMRYQELPVDIGYIPTYRAIDLIEESFRNYPDTDELFSRSPGMCSNQSSWGDWFREVNYNLMRLLSMYPGELNIREVEWVNLVNVLVDETISRETVNGVLRKWPVLRKQFL